MAPLAAAIRLDFYIIAWTIIDSDLAALLLGFFRRIAVHSAAPEPGLARVNPYDIESRDPGTGEVRVVIDTPASSRNKYKFDPATGLFRISRILPVGMAFPHDFGSPEANP